MSGYRQKFPIELTSEQMTELKTIASSRTAQVRTQQRAKILLLRSEGSTYAEIEKSVGVTGPTVAKVLKKFSTLGLKAALEDYKRSGRPERITREAKAWIISLACQIPETIKDAPKTQLWTISSLMKFARKFCIPNGHPSLENVHKSTIFNILNDREIKPHRVKYYLERKDPEFEDKAKDVLIVYKRVEWIMQYVNDKICDGYRADELCGEVFISYDEKPGIQAIENIAPDLPPNGFHGCLARDYEYRRHGTVSLLAGIDLFTGEIIGLVRDKHTSTEFIEFLKKVNDNYNNDLTINLILDNHSIHTSKQTSDFLSTLRKNRFNFIFTPKHASWLNLIESFFSKLARQALRHLRVKSKEDLIKRIENWIEETNRERVVYRWKWNLEDIQNAFLPKPGSMQKSCQAT